MSTDLAMMLPRNLLLGILVVGAVSFSSVAKAEFCGVAGQSPQEISASVAKTRKFKRVGGSALYVAYADKAAMVTLTVTKPANKAHPAVACRHAFQKNGEWFVTTKAMCGERERLQSNAARIPRA